MRILKELEDWIKDPNPECKIIWFYGPAGAGKSAIAQTTMQRASTAGRLGASFFFSRGAVGRSTTDRLFQTIAYQLAQNISVIENSIQNIVHVKPDLPSKTLEVQFRDLIDRPVRECKMSLKYPVVGIEGIDECEDENAQEAFLTVIGNAVRSGCPLRFIISSRPEPHLKRLFLRKFFDYTKTIVLETSDEFLGDIATYLKAGFTDICERHSSFMRHVPQPWPSKKQLSTLCTRSSGHFIYAATVLKFIGGDKFKNPVQQLHFVLEPVFGAEPSSLRMNCKQL